MSALDSYFEYMRDTCCGDGDSCDVRRCPAAHADALQNILAEGGELDAEIWRCGDFVGRPKIARHKAMLLVAGMAEHLPESGIIEQEEGLAMNYVLFLAKRLMLAGAIPQSSLASEQGDERP